MGVWKLFGSKSGHLRKLKKPGPPQYSELIQKERQQYMRSMGNPLPFKISRHYYKECMDLLNRQRNQSIWGPAQILFYTKHTPKSHEKRLKMLQPAFGEAPLYSPILKQVVPVKLTIAALRQIDKVGGLDEYFMNTPDSKLNSDYASHMRWKILSAKQNQDYEEYLKKQDALKAKGANGNV